MKKILWLVIPICLAALLLGAHAVFSFGGPHHSGAMGDMMIFQFERMAKDLNLTQDQQAKLDAIKQDSENNMQQSMEKHKQLHDTIQQQLSAGNLDFGQLRPLLDAFLVAGICGTSTTRIPPPPTLFFNRQGRTCHYVRDLPAERRGGR